MTEPILAQSPLRDQVESVLETQIRPMLRVHGGDISLLEVTPEGCVHLRFEGGCRGCALQGVTFSVGVRQRLLRIEGIEDVRMEGVKVSNAALERAARLYEGYSFSPSARSP